MRAIIRDGAEAFIGSQSLRKLELEGRREVGIIVKNAGDRARRFSRCSRPTGRSGRKAESDKASNREKDKDKDTEKR